MQTSTLNIEEVAATLNSVLPSIDKKEQRVAIELYRLLAKGEPVAVETLAEIVQLASDEIETLLDQWYGVFRDDEKRIIGFWGLALSETKHQFEVDGRRLHTWCAWDSLFIPEILQKSARVESTCPVTGDKIRLTATPEGVQAVDPPGAVMSFVLPERAKIEENVVRNFCHYVHFFSSAEAGSQWVSENDGTFIASMREAFALAKKMNASRFKDVQI